MSVVHPLAFLALAAVVIATPGPDTALTIRNTVRRGRTGGLWTALGVAAGQLVWVLATAVGVAALLATSEAAFDLVRLLGGAYLLLLGLSTLFGHRPTGVTTCTLPVRPVVAVRQGLISNLTNPKAAVFFPTLLPQFTRSEGEPALAMLALGAVFAALTLVWLCACACAIARFGRVLLRPRPRRALDLLTGSALVGFGCKLAILEGR